MATIDFHKIYTLQDKVLEIIYSNETTLYLTGGTCLNRFYYNCRFSDDLDLFTNENAIFRDDFRIVMENLRSSTLPYTIMVDTRDFVRLNINGILQVDLVNDRVYRYGKSILSSSGIFLDNVENICANKICAIIGRDDPKDMFDLYTIYKKGKINWKEAMEAARKKCVIDHEVLEFRLSSFPLKLLDLLNVVDSVMISDTKKEYPGMVEHILKSIP
ncbi:MAG: nucleotidyl transferase AbiEii/AbiGii toxin family protein [bacterium]